MKILIPSTIALSEIGSPGDTFHTYDVNSAIPVEHRDADVLVAWQNPPALLALAAQSLHQVRLVQALASGPDVVLAAGFDPSVWICGGRSLHDSPVAEHTLALLLACTRRFDRLHEAQKARVWDQEYIRQQAASESAAKFTLSDSNVLIWGFGSIATKLAPMLTLLGANVTGVASRPGMRSGYEVVSPKEAQELLPLTDILISILPASPETLDIFDSRIFGRLKKGSVFVNVGRGSTVNETALMSALREGTLRVAGIDVARDEPLPWSSALWAVENLLITPHVAGNRPQGAEALIRANVETLRVGGVLHNLVRAGS
ncbi:NAD(P)-dependent oxidoreductase [Arthrobacter sp. YN]|uniref:NAD(P)-dependent oxidoreductase n=1 Tax=Arthrobacter sp. YN TaxID=2020486 RepID=UPI000B5F7B76|nr:NAD(P)-dependent oxidoreductase [Arthrobacter sp. YN]ASN20079.1 phosphoglycerate dehydrogenase [Arthrobacter sp. YN]